MKLQIIIIMAASSMLISSAQDINDLTSFNLAVAELYQQEQQNCEYYQSSIDTYFFCDNARVYQLNRSK